MYYKTTKNLEKELNGTVLACVRPWIGSPAPQCGSILHSLEVKYQNKYKITSVSNEVENLEDMGTFKGSVKWCSHYGKKYGYLSKV